MPEESLDDLQELLEALAKVPEVVEEEGVFDVCDIGESREF